MTADKSKKDIQDYLNFLGKFKVDMDKFADKSGLEITLESRSGKKVKFGKKKREGVIHDRRRS
jgi:hypothetical protein